MLSAKRIAILRGVSCSSPNWFSVLACKMQGRTSTIIRALHIWVEFQQYTKHGTQVLYAARSPSAGLIKERPNMQGTVGPSAVHATADRFEYFEQMREVPRTIGPTIGICTSFEEQASHFNILILNS